MSFSFFRRNGIELYNVKLSMTTIMDKMRLKNALQWAMLGFIIGMGLILFSLVW